MVEPTQTEKKIFTKEETSLSKIDTADEDKQTPTHGQVATGAGDDGNVVTEAGDNTATGAGGNAAIGAQGVFKTFMGLFAGDALLNNSEQEALLGNLSSLFDGEPRHSVVSGGGNGVGAGRGNGVGAPAGVDGVGAPAGGNGVGALAGVNGVGAPAGVNGVGAPAGGNGVGAPPGANGFGAPPGANGVGAPAGGWFRQIWGSRHREGPNDIETGHGVHEVVHHPVAPSGGWFR